MSTIFCLGYNLTSNKCSLKSKHEYVNNLHETEHLFDMQICFLSANSALKGFLDLKLPFDHR